MADGNLGKDNKDESNSIENQRELLKSYVEADESFTDEIIPKDLRTFTVRAVYEMTMSAQCFVIHTFRQQRSRRTIDLSVTNPRISEWPMPVTDTEALSSCLSAPKLSPCRWQFAP